MIDHVAWSASELIVPSWKKDNIHFILNIRNLANRKFKAG